ncbi:MAG TPA: TraR/DksA C4-type zinc finger protein [Acidimicrobiales bacterium]|jgi:DnaK suppressor protein
MASRTDSSRPAAPHLDAETLASLRTSLLAERDEQRRLVAEHEAAVAELTGQPDMDSVRERALAEERRVRAAKALADVEHALQRMDAGDYGTCERCRGPIAVERLVAIPHARRCVGCPAPSRGF